MLNAITLKYNDNITRLFTTFFVPFGLPIGPPCVYEAFLNPLTSNSDQCLISPYSNTAQSNINAVRKKKVINKQQRS